MLIIIAVMNFIKQTNKTKKKNKKYEASIEKTLE